ncbi:MAG: hypothetical protein WCH75_07740, partial [Candidatus Binatia bacterium]
TARPEAVGIRVQRLLSGPGVRNITLRGMRGGRQGTAPLPTAAGLAVIAGSTQCRIRVNSPADRL